MPSINRIRVNNVKYNFGTQYYDDFTMRMYGKNTSGKWWWKECADAAFDAEHDSKLYTR